MSIALTSAVWKHSQAKGSARLVLLALADHAGADGRAWPSAARLARLTLLDVRNVQRALAKLIEDGEIVAVGTGKRGVVIYEFRPGGRTSQPTAEAPYVETPDLRRGRRTAEASYGGGVAAPTAEAPYVPTAEAPDKPSLTVNEPSKVAAECQQAVDIWNVVAEELQLPRVQRLTANRQSLLAARLTDVGGIAGWQLALDKVREIPGLRGQNERGWRCDFDWLVSESNFIKLMEDRYADWGTAPVNSAGRAGYGRRKGDPFSGVLAGLAEAARRAGNDQ